MLQHRKLHSASCHVTQELQLYLEKVSQLLLAGGAVRSSTGGTGLPGSSGGGGLQTEPEADYQRAVLASLATDPGQCPGSRVQGLGW